MWLCGLDGRMDGWMGLLLGSEDVSVPTTKHKVYADFYYVFIFIQLSRESGVIEREISRSSRSACRGGRFLF